MLKPSRILITAGPTIEPIDPIRFISNRSTGYMGYEIARVAKRRGYRVTLISGPTQLKVPEGIKIVFIETARQLKRRVLKELNKADILIMASAVSDYKPALFAKNKVKSKKGYNLKLVRNPDILSAVARKKNKGTVVVGFSLETRSLIKNSLLKLRNKKLDLIVANGLSSRNRPFGRGPGTAYVLDKHGVRKSLRNEPKGRIARAILDTIRELCYTPN